MNRSIVPSNLRFRNGALANCNQASEALSLIMVRVSVSGEGGQYFRVRPRNSSVLEGGEVTIPCEVGNRVGIVQWVKDGFAYVITPSK